MKAWQWSSSKGQLQERLTLNPEAPTQVAKNGLKRDHILIKVLSSSLNPADYKLPEGRLRLLFSLPAVPGMDFCGRVVALGSDVAAAAAAAATNMTDSTAAVTSNNDNNDNTNDPNQNHEPKISEGTIVFGVVPPFQQYGSLGEYVALPASMVGILPDGVDIDQAVTIGIAGETAHQNLLQGNLKAGDHIFINGGSSACGIYAIQIAKALGLQVTVSCSERNIEFVKGLGADEALDYTKEDLVVQLKEKGQVFDFISDMIGEPSSLYLESHHFLKPGKLFSQVTIDSPWPIVRGLLLPSFLGGGKRKWRFVVCAPNKEHLNQVASWIQNGKIKVPYDSVWDFEDVPKAFEKMRTKRARGKIVIHMSKE
jgi:NADPH:quinone reductase-like Zn-dependent oxidoreductase